MTTERFWTIPNILSLYRIFVFPFIFYLVLAGEEKLFAIFITISLLTDILDGWIARRFRMQTAIGAKLDSWADLGTYILAFMAIYYFKWEEIRPHALIFHLFVAAMALSYFAVFVKFGGLIGLHTYMFRIGGYLQGGFIIALFLWGFEAWLFYLCLGWGILACVEQVIIILWLRHPRSNVKGLYWLLKNGSR
ncbi:MAG TPA: CDP-alcohol phosphatidyltransferase family protein [Flavisolibacter sp.]